MKDHKEDGGMPEQLMFEGFEPEPVPDAGAQDEVQSATDTGKATPPSRGKAGKKAAREKTKTPPDETTPEEAPTTAQWAALYDVAQNIRKQEPWKHFYDMDLVTLMLPEQKEPVFCSIMGRAGDCFCIGVYPGFAALAGLQVLAESEGDVPDFLGALEQNCLMCYYGDREELVPRDREVLKALGLKFRGRNEWIYFRSMEPGYAPWYLTAGQVELMTQALQNLFMASKHFIAGENPVDFDAGETLLRYYEPKLKLWLNKNAPLPMPELKIPCVIVDNEFLTARLKRQKRTAERLELECTYFPAPVQENKNERPFLPRMLLLADASSAMIVGQHLVGRDEDHIDAMLDMLAEHISEHGRPVSLAVRDERVGCLVEDFCRKTGVRLVENQGVPVIDAIMSELLGVL